MTERPKATDGLPEKDIKSYDNNDLILSQNDIKLNVILKYIDDKSYWESARQYELY